MPNNAMTPELAKLYEDLMTGAREAPVKAFLGDIENWAYAGNLMVHILDTIANGGITDKADTSDAVKFRTTILTRMRKLGKY